MKTRISLIIIGVAIIALSICVGILFNRVNSLTNANNSSWYNTDLHWSSSDDTTMENNEQYVLIIVDKLTSIRYSEQDNQATLEFADHIIWVNNSSVNLTELEQYLDKVMEYRFIEYSNTLTSDLISVKEINNAK